MMTQAALVRWLAVPLLVLVLAGLAYGLWPGGRAPGGGGFDAAALGTAIAELDGGLDGDLEPGGLGDARSTAPISFPGDHGAHPDAGAELWELRARLQDEAGQPVSMRLSLARLGLAARPRVAEAASADPATPDAPGNREASGSAPNPAPESAPDLAPESMPESTEAPNARRASSFAADTLMAGELVLISDGLIPSDVVRAQRVSRAALGLAGAVDEPAGGLRVWIEDWSLSREADGSLLLRAAAEGAELALRLSPRKRPVVVNQAALGGPAGEGAAASVRFYSQSRLTASGTLRLGADDHGLHGALHGLAWLDHGWGEVAEALAGGRRQLVANRFQLQLDDGSEIACLHLRRRAGGGTPIPSCVLIGVDGETRMLQRRELTLAPTGRLWRADDGVGYPLSWRLLIPARALELLIEPLFADPSMALAPASLSEVARAWRGPVKVSGWRASDAIGGGGQMDLNGYGEQSAQGT